MRRSPGRRNGPSGAIRWAIALAAFSMAGTATRADPLPAEYLPTDHFAWRDLESLWNRGGLTGLPLFTRPLARIDVARSLLETFEAKPDLAASTPALRLRREFSRELAGLDADAGFRETAPLGEWHSGDASLRIQAEVRAAAAASGEEAQLNPGSLGSLVARVHLSPRAFALADVGVEKIQDGEIGDAIVKGSDAYLSTTAAYLSVRTDALDLAAGLLENRWGPGASGTLLLSDAALSYPGFLIGRTFGRKLRFVAITASLHQPEGRWFSAHRLELALSEDLSIAVHESAAYSSDGIDLVHASGVVPYTLAQRFLDRTRGSGSSAPTRNNVMTGIDLAWRFGGAWRIDGEFLIDDLATETSSQPDRLGFLGGLSWAGSLLGEAADARLEFAKVYRYTYAVFYGLHFIHDGAPLGFAVGPDSEHALAVLQRDLGTDARAGVGLELTRRGESPLGEFWGGPSSAATSSSATLSGTVETRIFPHFTGEVFWRDLLRLECRAGADLLRNESHVSGQDATRARVEIEALLQW
ncbi:MAG: capsule assembly Wzi family protein [Candidatus Eiseniibacteriota bacterium]